MNTATSEILQRNTAPHNAGFREEKKLKKKKKKGGKNRWLQNDFLSLSKRLSPLVNFGWVLFDFYLCPSLHALPPPGSSQVRVSVHTQGEMLFIHMQTLVLCGPTCNSLLPSQLPSLEQELWNERNTVRSSLKSEGGLKTE